MIVTVRDQMIPRAMVGSSVSISVSHLVKAGAEGYIHGWICVKPPCGKKNDFVSHADHGIGMIDDVDDAGNKHAFFTDGTTGTLGDQGDPDEVSTKLKEKAKEDAERRKPTGFYVKKDASLTQDERMSVDGYTSEAGNRVYNDPLRAGKSPSNYHTSLDSAISKSSAARGGVVYRGLALPENTDLSPGTEFTDPAYMSTTEDRNFAEAFAQMRATGVTPEGLNTDNMKVFGGKPVVMRIPVQQGDHMMRGDTSVKEIVLPRGQRYRVSSVDTDGTVNLERAS